MSEPLASDLTVSGKIAAHLCASSSGTDSDWIVKLIDVYPEKYAADPEMGGYQLMIAGDVFRAGHRIMVQVQSSWFPVIDRNPQTFVPNIFHARASDFQRATQRVFRSGSQASYITVPTMSGVAGSKRGLRK